MEIIKDGFRFILKEEDKVLLETGYLNGEFVLGIYTDEEIKITCDLNKALYENLRHLLDNSYMFSDGVSFQTEDTITYLSNERIDWLNGGIENLNRLVIRKDDKAVYLRSFNPYLNKHNIKTDGYIISFSTNKNCLYNANLETGKTLQDDIISALKNTALNVYKLKLREIPLKKK